MANLTENTLKFHYQFFSITLGFSVIYFSSVIPGRRMLRNVFHVSGEDKTTRQKLLCDMIRQNEFEHVEVTQITGISNATFSRNPP